MLARGVALSSSLDEEPTTDGSGCWVPAKYLLTNTNHHNYDYGYLNNKVYGNYGDYRTCSLEGGGA